MKRAVKLNLRPANTSLMGVGFALLGACAPAGAPLVELYSARLPQSLEGTCSVENSGTLEFAENVANLRAVVSGPGIDEPIEKTGPVGTLTIDEIPQGTDRVLTLFGLTEAGAETWRGYKAGITVEKESDTKVDLLLAAKADLSCPRTGQDQPRAFHTATMLLDGTVLLVGGANNDGPNGDCDVCGSLSATSFAEIYNPSDGTFRRTGSGSETSALTFARFFHTATLLSDGRVAIVGGTGEAELVAVDGQNPFPIKPTSPIDAIEVYDPETELFEVVALDPEGPRVFHAAVVTGEDNLLIMGGIPGIPASGAHDFHNALNSTTLCAGSALNCTTGPAMNKPRAGHLAYHIVLESDANDVDQIIVWGGSVETGNVNGVAGYQLEGLGIGGAAFEMKEVAGMTDSKNLFFATGIQYVDFRVLVAGGLQRESDGTFQMATSPESADASAAGVYIYTADSGEEGGISKGAPVMLLSNTRFLAASASLPDKIVDGQRFGRGAIAGGFRDLALTPDSHLEIFNEDEVIIDDDPSIVTSRAISEIEVGGSPRSLRQARAGLAATSIGDGTILFSGGESIVDDSRTPLQTSEIFSDPLDPPTEVE